MEEKIRYSDQTPKEEQPPVPQASDNPKVASGPMDDSEQAEKAEKSARVGREGERRAEERGRTAPTRSNLGESRGCERTKFPARIALRIRSVHGRDTNRWHLQLLPHG
jgi:hypothetical protein